MTHFLHLPEKDLAAFARNIANGLEQIAADLTIDSDLTGELAAAVGEFENVLDEHAAARVHLKSLTQKKKKLNGRLKDLLKRSNKEVRSKSETTEAQLRLLGLKPYDATRTAAAIPETAPYLMLEIQKDRRHTLRVRDREDVGSRAKPRGVLGAEIWMRVGDAGTLGETDYRYLGLTTNGAFTFRHDAADTGKPAYYVARWLNRKAERGGWSDTASATIAQ
jgi:hypothetical protein